MTLYCVAIGESVFRQLLQIGVRAVRVPAETTIEELLQEIQHYWYDKEQRKIRATAIRSALHNSCRRTTGRRTRSADRQLCRLRQNQHKTATQRAVLCQE